MSISLPKKTAQKIVDTVKDVCGYDINFINKDGIIFASTDESRMGEFHELGKRVIETQKIVEATKDNGFLGTHKGVNIPFIYKKQVIAAIGISGEPKEVRKYALLAQKITSLILKEQELDAYNYGKRRRTHYILDALLGNKEISKEYIEEFLAGRGLSWEETYRTILVKIYADSPLSNVSLLENEIYGIFERIPRSLYTFDYPNEYRALVTEESYKKYKSLLYRFAKDRGRLLQVGVGEKDSLQKQYQSYESAKIALKSLSGGENIASYDDLSLEILLGSLSQGAVRGFLDKILKNLSREEILFLKSYYECDMSLSETAKRLYLHKNTVQYKLKGIEKKTQYSPRKFKDAVLFYMAIRMQ